jgi:FkbM family methyltransferase
MNHFLDVGANIGQTFKDYLNPRAEYDGWNVWCFEPSPRHIHALMDEAKHQSSRYTIHVCPFGVRGYSGILPFYTKDDPRGDSFEENLASDHQTNNLNEGYSLHAVSYGIASVILSASKTGDQVVLKLDCEGSEYDILAALLHRQESLKRVSRILVEWHKIDNPIRSSEELIEDFIKAGKPLEAWMF